MTYDAIILFKRNHKNNICIINKEVPDAIKLR